MKLSEHTMPMPPPIRPNGNPARILEKRIGKKSRRRIKLVTNEWPNLHRLGSSPKMHWRRQGDLGELSAMEWFASQGAIVCFPIGHSPDWDFIADLDGCLLRVQVKTCIAFHNRRWRVTVCTRGGNQSWSGLVKRFEPASCDYLFAVVGDGRRWCIPADGLGGRLEWFWEVRSTPSSRSSRAARSRSQPRRNPLYNRLLTSSGGCPSG